MWNCYFVLILLNSRCSKSYIINFDFSKPFKERTNHCMIYIVGKEPIVYCLFAQFPLCTLFTEKMNHFPYPLLRVHILEIVYKSFCREKQIKYGIRFVLAILYFCHKEESPTLSFVMSDIVVHKFLISRIHFFGGKSTQKIPIPSYAETSISYILMR